MESMRVLYPLMLASVAVGQIRPIGQTSTLYPDDRGTCANYSHEHLSDIPKVPLNTTVLDLSYNDIKTVNTSFKQLKQLQYLNLSNNNIIWLEHLSFEDCQNLLHLDLSHNKLVLDNILDAFEYLPHLRFLNLKQNVIRGNWTYPESFCFLQELETLKIDASGFFNFTTGFGHLTGLRNLFLGGKNCDIKNLTKEIFEPLSGIALDHLDISHCKIVSIEQDVFTPLKNLTRLSLRHSPVGVKQGLQALSPFVGRKMHKIDFHKIHTSTKQSAIKKINESIIHEENLTYLRGICVKNFHLSHNLLLFIDTRSLQNSTFAACIRKLFLGVNSFFYQQWKYLQWFSTVFIYIEEFDISSQVHVMKAIPRMYFAGVNVNRTSCDDMNDIILHNLTIPIHVPPSLTNLNLAALTYEFDGPPGNILVNNAINFTRLNMSFLGLTKFCYSLSGLDALEFFDLSGNPELSLKDSFFETFQNLSHLYLSYFSFPQDVMDKQGKRLLRPLNKLKYLSISTNRLKSLPKKLFSANRQLVHLDVSNNLFTIIPFSMHLTPKIITIDIQFNSIEYINNKGRLQIDNHIRKTGIKLKLFLKGNVLICDCTSFNFLVWLVHTHAVLDDKDNCFLRNGEKSTIAKEIEDKEFLKLWKRCIGFGLFYMALTLFITTVASTFVALLVKTNKTALIDFIEKIIHPKRPKPKRDDFKRDLYISYAEDDYQWVCHHLCPALEERHLSLFIWDRDSVPGDSIPDQIVENVQSCWKILLYYTDNFQQDPWTYMSIMTAINLVDDNSPEKVLLLLPEDENPQVPYCLLEVIPETCIIRVPGGSCNHGSEELWKTIARKVKEK